MDKIEQSFRTTGMTIKVGSSETKEVKLEHEEEDITVIIKGSLDTELMKAFGKHLIDEQSDINISFTIPNQTQKSIEDY